MSRALERGLHGAVAVMLLAIAGAALFPESEGERLTTVVYLAAGFAAVLLAVRHRLPASSRARVEATRTSVPAKVAFVLVVVAALVASAMEAGSLSGELLIAAACGGAVVIAALFPSGLIAPLHRMLSQSGPLMMATRYAVLFGMCAWAIAATVPDAREAAASIGFALLTIASVLALAVLRGLRDMVAGLTVAALTAIAIAAIVPAISQDAADAAYALIAVTVALLFFRQRFALSRGDSIDA